MERLNGVGLTEDFLKNSSMVSRYFVFWITRIALCCVALSAPHAQSQPSSSPGSVQVAQEMAFKDFFQMPFGPKGLAFTPKALALDGQRVSITGYMVNVEQPVAGTFILSPRPVEINDHADGEANDLPAHAVWVILHASQSATWVPHRSGLIQLRGRLSLGRQESDSSQVSWIRLHLDPGAVQVQGESTPHVPLLPLAPRV